HPSAHHPMKYRYDELAKMIDHSLLHPTMTDQELKAGCEVAAKYQVASVCIKPYAVKQAAQWLQGTDVIIGCVIGFPHGNGATEHDLELMRSACSSKVQVKAAGGVRDLDGLIRVRDLGASRCGASATAAILDEYRRREASGQPQAAAIGKIGAGGY